MCPLLVTVAMVIELTIDLHSEYIYMDVLFIASPIISAISNLNIFHVSRKALITNINKIVYSW